MNFLRHAMFLNVDCLGLLTRKDSKQGDYLLTIDQLRSIYIYGIKNLT